MRLTFVNKLLVFLLLFVTVMGISVKAPAAALGEWSQSIEITTPSRPRIVGISVDDSVSGDGSEADPFVTSSSDISLSARIHGAGKFIVTNETNDVVHTAIKDSPDLGTLNLSVPLQGGVGLNKLTATLVDIADTNTVHDSRNIFVNFRPTTIRPDPDVPDTGILYIGSRAFLVRDVFSVGLFAILIAATIFLYLRHLTKNIKY